MKFLNLLNVESVSGERASLSILGEVLPRMFEKVSQSLKYDSICPPTYIYYSPKSTGTRDELSITLYLQSEINFCSVRMPVNA